MELKEKLIEIISKVEDEKVLKDMFNLICCIYKHYSAGTWGAD